MESCLQSSYRQPFPSDIVVVFRLSFELRKRIRNLEECLAPAIVSDSNFHDSSKCPMQNKEPCHLSVFFL